MFEVILSNVNTGSVRRTLFQTREQAERHVDQFFSGGGRCVPARRNYRVEVYPRTPAVEPAVRPLVAAAEVSRETAA